MHSFKVNTGTRQELLDITPEVARLLPELGISDGVVYVFSPHTTAAITINEAYDPDVAADMLDVLDALAPHRRNYRHAEGNSAAHLKTSLIGPGVLVPVEDGRLCLGVWQGIFFCEFDGPRQRSVWVRKI